MRDSINGHDNKTSNLLPVFKGLETAKFIRLGALVVMGWAVVASTGCQSMKQWSPKLPEFKMPSLAWGKGLNFGKDKPNKDDLVPPSRNFPPTEMDPSAFDSSNEMLAGGNNNQNSYGQDTGYNNEPINRDPNLERAPYSRSRRPEATLASNRSDSPGFGNNSYGNNGLNGGGLGSKNLGGSNGLASSNNLGGGLPSSNLLPTGQNPGSHQPNINGIPGGPLPTPGNINSGQPLPTLPNNGLSAGGLVSNNQLPPLGGMPSSNSLNANNGLGNNGLANNGLGVSNPLQPANSLPAPGSFPSNGALPGPGNFSGRGGMGNSNGPGNVSLASNGATSLPVPGGSFPAQPASAIGSHSGMVQPAAPVDTTNMLKPFRPGSTAKPASPASSKSSLPSYPSTGYGSFQSGTTRSAQKPATGLTPLPRTSTGGMPKNPLQANPLQPQTTTHQKSSTGGLTRHPNGVICDGDKCYLPQN